MEKTTINSLGKFFSILGIILAGLGTFLTALAPTLAPGDVHDVIYGAAVFCVALGVYLAHKYPGG